MSVSTILIIIGLKLLFAIIPNYIADVKGYDKKLFYLFGLVSCVLATTQALVLPDKNDDKARAFDGNTFKYLTIGGVVLYLQLVLNVIVGDFNYDGAKFTNFVITFALYLMLFVSIYTFRNTILTTGLYSILSFVSFIDFYRCLKYIMTYRVSENPPIVPAFFESLTSLVLCVFMIVLIHKYAFIRDAKWAYPVPRPLSLSLGLAPFGLAVVSRILGAIASKSAGVTGGFGLNLIISILYCLGFLFIGLVYYEDSQYLRDREADAEFEEYFNESKSEINIGESIFHDSDKDY